MIPIKTDDRIALLDVNNLITSYLPDEKNTQGKKRGYA
jgi:hypothetical protein